MWEGIFFLENYLRYDMAVFLNFGKKKSTIRFKDD